MDGGGSWEDDARALKCMSSQSKLDLVYALCLLLEDDADLVEAYAEFGDRVRIAPTKTVKEKDAGRDL